MENILNTSWHSYPSIFALGHRYLADLFKDDVLIEEKVDGSQFAFGKFKSADNIIDLRCRSKGCQLNVEFPEKMFEKAVNTAKELNELLHLGWTYRAEYLSKPKHNTLVYSRTPEKFLILFDINSNEEEYLSYKQKQEEAKRIGLELVPKIYFGKIEEPQKILEMINTPSILGGTNIEGVVIKNYNRFGQNKKVLMGKYVSEQFKEVHNKDWKDRNLSKTDLLERIVLEYKTPARWLKTIQHLKESGKLENSPKDIGLLIKECGDDIEKECADEIKTKLYEWSKGRIRRGCVAGLPEWYKEYLLKESFKK